MNKFGEITTEILPHLTKVEAIGGLAVAGIVALGFAAYKVIDGMFEGEDSSPGGV